MESPLLPGLGCWDVRMLLPLAVVAASSHIELPQGLLAILSGQISLLGFDHFL